MKTQVLFFFLTLFLCTGVFASRIVFLGDSLTEGYGVAKEKAYPALLERKIRNAKLDWTVVNAGVSGSTSASAKSRLEWQLRKPPEILFLALGANDGLRGLKPEEMRKNLESAIAMARAKGVTVFLVGMMMPPNYGGPYREAFQKVFPEIAKKTKVRFVPFLLDGVAGDSSLNLADGIHPNEKGHAVIADHLWKALEPVLRQSTSKKAEK